MLKRRGLRRRGETALKMVEGTLKIGNTLCAQGLTSRQERRKIDHSRESLMRPRDSHESKRHRVRELKIFVTVVNQVSYHDTLTHVFSESFAKLVAKGIVPSSSYQALYISLNLTAHTVVKGSLLTRNSLLASHVMLLYSSCQSRNPFLNPVAFSYYLSRVATLTDNTVNDLSCDYLLVYSIDWVRQRLDIFLYLTSHRLFGPLEEEMFLEELRCLEEGRCF